MSGAGVRSSESTICAKCHAYVTFWLYWTGSSHSLFEAAVSWSCLFHTLWHFKQLAFAIKYWAKQREVNDPSGGTLSSYAWVIMLVCECVRARASLCVAYGDAMTLVHAPC